MSKRAHCFTAALTASHRGGDDTIAAVEPRLTRVVHGNTLTAAVVIENIMAALQLEAQRCCQEGMSFVPEIFLTGATSKVTHMHCGLHQPP